MSSVGLSWLLVTGDRAFTWLVTVLASTLSSPGFLCCLARWLRCATLLYLWLCAHLLLGLEFPRLLACPSPSIRLLVSWFQWVFFSTRVPNLRDGVTPAGSWIVCPRSKRRFRVPIWIRCTGQFSGWTSHLSLRLLCAPCPSGCVARWSSLCPWASVVLSSLQCSLLSHIRVTCCLHDPCYGSGVVIGTLPSILPDGVRASVGGSSLRPAATGASFPGGPHWSCGSSAVLGSLLCAPLTVGLLPDPPALHYLLSAGCLLWLETSPSGEASASAWQFSWCPGAAGALTVALTAAASLRELYPLCLVLPLRGSATFLAFVPQLEALSESLTHSIPRPFLVVGFADALWLCPERALRLFLKSVSLVDPVALSPLSRSVYAYGFHHWWAFRSCGGASPHALGSVGALGELRWLHLYRLTPDLVGLCHFAVCRWSSGRCFIFYCTTFRTYSWRSFCQFHWLMRVPEWLGWRTVPLLALPGLCHLRWLIVTTVCSWCILR